MLGKGRVQLFRLKLVAYSGYLVVNHVTFNGRQPVNHFVNLVPMLYLLPAHWERGCVGLSLLRAFIFAENNFSSIVN